MKPQERPLRPKRSRKPEDESVANHGPSDNNGEPVSSTLPTLMPAVGSHYPSAGYDPSGPVSNLNSYPQVGSTRTAPIALRGGSTLAPGDGLASSPPRHHQPGVANTSPFTPIASASGGHGQPAHHVPPPPASSPRNNAAFEDFANRNKDKIIGDLAGRYGGQGDISERAVHYALVQKWHAMDVDDKRQYGDTAGENNEV